MYRHIAITARRLISPEVFQPQLFGGCERGTSLRCEITRLLPIRSSARQERSRAIPIRTRRLSLTFLRRLRHSRPAMARSSRGPRRCEQVYAGFVTSVAYDTVRPYGRLVGAPGVAIHWIVEPRPISLSVMVNRPLAGIGEPLLAVHIHSRVPQGAKLRTTPFSTPGLVFECKIKKKRSISPSPRFSVLLASNEELSSMMGLI